MFQVKLECFCLQKLHLNLTFAGMMGAYLRGVPYGAPLLGSFLASPKHIKARFSKACQRKNTLAYSSKRFYPIGS
jgi:hypothetical protein